MRRLAGLLSASSWFVLLLNVTVIAGSGTSAGFEFLRTPIGARPSAMAGAFVSTTGDIHALYFNPAGLSTISGRVATATYLHHVLDFQSGFAGYCQSLQGVGQLAVGIAYMSYGEFDATDINGQKIGNFNAGSLAFTSALARPITHQLLAGVAAKVIHTTIDQYSSTALAVDLGLIYQAPFFGGMNIGLGVFNLGQALTAFIDTKDPLPLNFAAGFSKKLAHLPLEYQVAVTKYIDDDFQVRVGGEFTLSEGFFLRLGYTTQGRDQKIGANGDQFAGFSTGLGLHWRQMQFDYGLSSFGAIGYLNRATISYSF